MESSSNWIVSVKQNKKSRWKQVTVVRGYRKARNLMSELASTAHGARIVREVTDISLCGNRLTARATKPYGARPVSPNIPSEAIPVFLFMDGSHWCAVRSDFVNLQESVVGFGDAHGSAVADLESNEAKKIKA